MESHYRGSEESHNRNRGKDVKANDMMEKWNQEEIDKEITELKEQLDALMMLLE